MFTPYTGQDPYIFISYRHQDSPRILPLLDALDAAGYRVWYDEGIPWTSEWPAVIAERLQNCGVCIAFHSRTSVESKHCKQEIYYAAHFDKPVLSVYLDDVTLAPGTELTLLTMQAVKLFRQPGPAWFLRRLDAEPVFAACKRPDAPVSTAEHGPAQSGSTVEHAAQGPAETREHAHPLSRSAYAATGLVYLLLGVGCCAFLAIYLLDTTNPEAVFLVPLGVLACVGAASIFTSLPAWAALWEAPDLYADGETLWIVPRPASGGSISYNLFAYRFDFPKAGRAFKRVYIEPGISEIAPDTFRDFPQVAELSLPPQTNLADNAFPYTVRVVRRTESVPSGTGSGSGNIG